MARANRSAPAEEYRHAAEFRAALRRFLRTSEESARRHGLTPRRHLLLLMIKGAEDGSESSTVGELCGRLQLAQSTVTELVQRTEAAGLLRREQSDADGRVAHLMLTAEGERRLAAVTADLRREREILSHLLGELERSLPRLGQR
jgi:DNA-binding MarR family transcriptional regulator